MVYLTGIGADWGIDSASSNPDWTPFFPFIAPWVQKGYSTSRLGFVFPGLTGESVLDYNNFDKVVQQFADNGLKVIALLQNNPDDSGAE